MRVRVTCWEKQYYEFEVELDKLPETQDERDAAFDKAVESDSMEMGDNVTGDIVFEEVKE